MASLSVDDESIVMVVMVMVGSFIMSDVGAINEIIANDIERFPSFVKPGDMEQITRIADNGITIHNTEMRAIDFIIIMDVTL